MLFLPRFEPGRRQQAERVVEAMGGKGCNVSLVLRALGEPTLATGLAGGANGERVDAFLRDHGVETDFVWTAGETRINTVLIETETGRHTTLCAEGLRPPPGDRYELLRRLVRHAGAAAAVAVCGSLPGGWPPEYYGELARQAGRGGVPVVVDAAGDALRFALRAGVAAVKPNRQELESVAEGPVETRDQQVAAARALCAAGARLVVASLGDEGALALTDGEAWYAPPLSVELDSPAGAGDGMVAMIALGLAHGWEVAEILRRAVATASAIVTTPGTAECPADLVRELVPRVQVEPI